MNRALLYFFFLFISFSFFNYGCKSGKQATSFKDSKQSIDTLALFSPHVIVEAATKTQRLPDDELALKLSDKISGTTISTLKRKYRLENEPFFLEPSLDGEISAFFNDLDSLESGVDNIPLPYWLKNDRYESKGRYFMATFVYGYYHPDYEPNYVMTQSLRTNTILLGRSGLNWVSIKIVLADRKTNKILFYNADNSYQSDPRILSSVEAMIKKLIQPIYYR
ncbi:hypothetical protein [Marivirga sp.]|uniref:hypothetical protein n=1 Tax=Marivirga sp. TaxID=2018662 RepID=UPI0025CF8EE4|nr:hypothetical protein [Marivirga sp.]